jgi:site-specific recombinase XerD
MYQYGEVDIRSLQALLGHASVATTEIYTHINQRALHDAVEQNPLNTERIKP